MQATPLPAAAAASTASRWRLVGQRHDDEVDLGVGAQRLDRVVRPAPEALGERRAAIRVPVGVGHDPRAGDVAQAERVELADEARAEHPDADVAHRQ